MTVPASEPLGPAEVSGLFAPGASSASAQAAQDKEMFLNLMVAQLRYQDPMNPADMGEFMAQNAQFQALEKMQEVADATAALMNQQMAFGAAGLVGREVAWPDAEGRLVRGTVGGVSFSADGPVLDVAGHSVALNQVQAVGSATTRSDAAPAPGAATATAQAPAAITSTATVTGGAVAAGGTTTDAAAAAAAAADRSARDTRPVTDGSLAAVTETPDSDPGDVGVLL